MIATLLAVPASPVLGGAVSDLLVILAVAALVAIVLQRIRLAVIPGYLIAGVIIGPGALALVPAPDALGEISHLAIVLLMFGIGLELHLSALKHRFVRMLLSGVLSCGLSVLIGVPAGLMFGLAMPAAIVVGMALSLSSTAVVLRILSERRTLQTITGRLNLSILVVQDVLVLAMLAAIPALAKWSGTAGTGAVGPAPRWLSLVGWEQLLLDQGMRFGGVLGLMILFRIVAPWLLNESLRRRSLEVLTISSLAFALGLAVAVRALGFSLEMGAFLAGFLLAGTPFRHHLSGQIRPLRDILIAIFFTTVGMKLDPTVIATSWWIVLVGTAVLIIGKTVAIAGACWGLGATASISLAVGVSLAQAGEFSLVVLGIGNLQGVLDRAATGTAMAIVVLSLVLTPALISGAPRLAGLAGGLDSRRRRRGPPLPETGVEAAAAEPPPQVVVAGFGHVGRRIVDQLEHVGFRCSVVELNPVTVRREARTGRDMVFGDVASDEVLESAQLQRAVALVLTIPDDRAVAQACAPARRMRPDLLILARTALVNGAEAARRAGADEVTVDEIACADALVSLALDRLRASASKAGPAPLAEEATTAQ